MNKPFTETSVVIIAVCAAAVAVVHQIRGCYTDHAEGRNACLSAGGDPYRCCMEFTLGHSGKRPETHCAPLLTPEAK